MYRIENSYVSEIFFKFNNYLFFTGTPVTEKYTSNIFFRTSSTGTWTANKFDQTNWIFAGATIGIYKSSINITIFNELSGSVI